MTVRQGRGRGVVWTVAITLALTSLASGANVRRFPVARGDNAPHKIITPHFKVEFSVPRTTGCTYADLCERAYKNFLKKFNVAPTEAVWKGKCRVLLFRGRREFKHFAVDVHKSRGAAEAGGYTRIQKTEPDIVLFLDKGNHTKLKQVLIHEMTHVFLQLFGDHTTHINTWLHEGFAQYFEFKVEPRRSRLASSRTRIKELVKTGAAKPLVEFWHDDFPATDLDSYAQAWSLIDFMIKKGSAKRTGKFVLLIKKGEDQEAALRKTFGCSLARLERMWKRYVVKAY